MSSTEPEQPKPLEYVRLPMICVCKDEGKAEAKALMDEVYARFNKDDGGPQMTAENFLTTICYSLSFEYNAFIDAIMTDQWHGVVVERFPEKRGGPSPLRIYVQCDMVEHGIAAAWLELAKRGPVED